MWQLVRQQQSEGRMDRLEVAMQELAEAQRRTAEEMRGLTVAMKEMRWIVRTFQRAVGYMLEDRACAGLPALLKSDFGIEVVGRLTRNYVRVGKRDVEVNIFGKGRKDGEEVWIVGEAKTQVYERDVKQFERTVEELKTVLGENLFLVMVGYQITPEVQQYLRARGIAFYISTALPL